MDLFVVLLVGLESRNCSICYGDMHMNMFVDKSINHECQPKDAISGQFTQKYWRSGKILWMVLWQEFIIYRNGNRYVYIQV
jgi:hypothetical protein